MRQPSERNGNGLSLPNQPWWSLSLSLSLCIYVCVCVYIYIYQIYIYISGKQKLTQKLCHENATFHLFHAYLLCWCCFGHLCYQDIVPPKWPCKTHHQQLQSQTFRKLMHLIHIIPNDHHFHFRFTDFGVSVHVCLTMLTGHHINSVNADPICNADTYLCRQLQCLPLLQKSLQGWLQLTQSCVVKGLQMHDESIINMCTAWSGLSI